ncbi:MAG: AMP-binding protein, partial [Acidobacteriota bacterium]
MGEPRFGETLGTLNDLLRTRAREMPEKTAFSFLVDGEQAGDRLLYGELDARARSIAAQLVRAGAVGERALLLYPPGLEFAAAFFGCLYAGTVAVPAYPPARRTLDRLRSIALDAQPRVALTTAGQRARYEALLGKVPELGGLHWLATDEAAEAPAGAWSEPPVGRDALALLQYTSGSTAAPKGVEITHGNLLSNEEMIRQAFGQSSDSVVVGWLPVYHDMGLIGNLLQPI